MSLLRPLYGSRPLADWVRAGGRPARPAAAHALKLAWHAYWFEHNWRATAQRLDAHPLPEDPVFILGFWRSGTTVLHELIAAATRWTTPRTWQCFHPSTCFLTGPPARAAAADRPMDRGRIATFGPQEDEFALLLLGEPSAYRGFIDPRRLDECARLTRDVDADELPRWQTFLRGIASRPGGPETALPSAPGPWPPAGSASPPAGSASPPAGSASPPAGSAASPPAGSASPPANSASPSSEPAAALPAGAASSAATPLLLKSPGHTFRLPRLRTLFPRARFIWIGRDSGEVLASNARMWRAMMERYALWGEPSGALDHFLLDALGACAAMIERCLDEMPVECLLWIDFAELTAEPRRVLAGALRFLRPAVPDAAHFEQRLNQALAQVAVHAGARASAPDEERARAMDRIMAAARQRFSRPD
jgi:hypothetical protein